MNSSILQILFKNCLIDDNNFLDPNTKKFIKDRIDPVFGYPDLVRFSWSTSEVALKDTAFTCTWEDDEDIAEKKKSAGSKRISSFFSPKQENGITKKKRHNFFVERHLQFAENL